MIDVPVKRNLDENIPVRKMLGEKLELLYYELRNFHGLREHPGSSLFLTFRWNMVLPTPKFYHSKYRQ